MDAVIKVAEVSVSVIPFVGGPAAILLSEVFEPPLTRRKEAWMNQLYEVVTDLQNRVDDLEGQSLSENEMFVSTAMRASSIAVQTHQEAKLRMLANAVRNSALKGSPEEDLQFIFLGLVERLTVSHVSLLRALVVTGQTKLYYHHTHGTGSEGDNKRYYLRLNLSGYKGNEPFFARLLRDLRTYGLVDFPDTFTQPAPDGDFQRRIPEMALVDLAELTPMGNQFLAYVSFSDG
jgi:hypothetical protein